MSIPLEGTYPLALRLFGPFDVQVDGRALPRLRSQKGQWLLGLLILRHDQSLERTWLAGLLWPDSTESQALANLRLSLTDLRKALGVQAKHLQAPTPRTLRFALAGAWADVAVFDAAVQQEGAGALATAVAVYRGALLEGCEEEWLTPERQVRAEMYHTALETLAGCALTSGSTNKAVSYLRRLAAADPSRESACRMLMQALAETGDYAGVTRVYRDFRLYLHRELNSSPDEETVSLYEGLRNGREKARSRLPPAQGTGAASLPSLVCLVTSRSALHVAGEIQYRVTALGFPAEVKSVAELLDFPGVQLYVQRAVSRRAGFLLTPDNAPAVVALCAKLEGIPLAIELVAAWADMLTPAQMLARLEERFAFPTQRSSPLPERHESLQAVFDSSYSLLDTSEQRLLCDLAVFAGGWTLEAAEAVCGEAIDTQEKRRGVERQAASPQMLLLLKRLVEKSLVLFQEKRDTGIERPRYQLLEITRQYALEQLSPEQRDSALQRHADFFFQHALLGEAEFAADRPISQALQTRKGDTANYHAALRHCKQTNPDRALQLLTAMGNCEIVKMHSSEVQEWILRLAAQKLPPPSALQAKLYCAMARWARYSTSPVWLALMEKAYALAQECDDKQHMAHTLFYLGAADMERGNLERARQRLESAADLAREAGDLIWAPAIRQQLIYVTCAEHDFVRAQTMAEALLQWGREGNQWSVTAHALEALEHIANIQKDYLRARSYGEQVLAIYPATETIGRTNTLRSLSRTAALQEDFQAARDYLTASVTICQEGGALAHEAWSYCALANVAQRQGNSAEAKRWMRQALHLFAHLGETGSMAVCLNRLAWLLGTQSEEAAFLWSAYARFLQENGVPCPTKEQEELETARAALRSVFSEDRLTVLETRSAALTLREVVEYALGIAIED